MPCSPVSRFPAPRPDYKSKREMKKADTVVTGRHNHRPRYPHGRFFCLEEHHGTKRKADNGSHGQESGETIFSSRINKIIDRIMSSIPT